MEPVAADVNLLEAVNFAGLLSGLVILAATFVVQRMVSATLEGLGTRFTDKRLLLNQVATLLRFSIYLVGIALAVSASVSLSRDVILALTGTAAVTIGLALKDLTSSVLAGVVILLDRPFQVGDRVAFDGVYGEIKAIGLRSVVLVTLDDNVVTIPNNKFLTDTVSSGNWGALDMLIQMDFHIGADQDRVKARKLAEEVITSSRYAYAHKPWVVLLNQVVLGDMVAVRLRCKVYVLDVQYEKALESDVTERMLAAFDEHGIRPPAILHRALEATRASPVVAGAAEPTA